MVIRLLGQGLVPPPPLELLSKLVLLSDVEVHIPLGEDVSRVDVLLAKS